MRNGWSLYKEMWKLIRPTRLKFSFKMNEMTTCYYQKHKLTCFFKYGTWFSTGRIMHHVPHLHHGLTLDIISNARQMDQEKVLPIMEICILKVNTWSCAQEWQLWNKLCHPNVTHWSGTLFHYHSPPIQMCHYQYNTLVALENVELINVLRYVSLGWKQNKNNNNNSQYGCAPRL